MATLFWYKRDLRVEDHPALAMAADQGDVIPLYVLEPEYWALPDTSGRQFAFLKESLLELRAQLRALGSDLVVRTGDAVGVLQDLRSETGFTTIVSHEETGNSWTYTRDRRVAAWACANGVVWHELPQSGVVRRLAGRDGWAKHRNLFLSKPKAETPIGLSEVRLKSDPITYSGAPDHCPELQNGGRSRALSLLDGFLTTRGQTYRKDMSSPLQGAVACSRLSPHLAFGTISVREVSQACAARQRAIKGGPRDGWFGSLKSFQSRLAWRDHFMQKLEDEPALEHRCLHRAYEGMRSLEPDATLLHAWQAGETGLPFLDACMRSLEATGWLNFRMRAMVVAVASYHLWVDWRPTGRHLARMFTDYEPGIHWSQMQMQSGTTGINTPRIYNPIKQGMDQDPTGAFTRRWVPELSDVPGKHLQTPWKWELAGSVMGKTYPEPIIDVAADARAARQKIFSMRGSVDRNETQRVIHKHASRKDSAGHFVNDRLPRVRRRRKDDDAQLKLDL